MLYVGILEDDQCFLLGKPSGNENSIYHCLKHTRFDADAYERYHHIGSEAQHHTYHSFM